MTEPIPAEAAEPAFDQRVALLETLLARAPVGLGLLDCELRFVRLNDALARGNGAPREAHLGRAIDVLWPSIPADLLSRLHEVARGAEAVMDYPVDVVLPTGGSRHVLGSYYPVRAADGTILGVGVVVFDVTARTHAEQALRASEERARRSESAKSAILDAALDAIVTMDAEGRVVEFNPAAERTFGYAAADVTGRELAELIVPPSLRARHRAGVRRRLRGRVGAVLGQRVEMVGMRADGSEFPLELAITGIDAPGAAIYSGHLRDLTAAKEAEAALARLAREQAALRRVATLVARSAEPAEIFAAVTEEAARQLEAATCNLLRFDGAAATVVAGWSEPGVGAVPVGDSIALDADTAVGRVRLTGEPARTDSYEGIPGELAERLRSVGVRAAVACPIGAGGTLFGALVASTVRADLPFEPGAERKLADFADLVAQALANAEAREQLRASRVRLVETADAERKRLERNLHDGAQQRLVSLALQLRMVEARLPADTDELRGMLGAAQEELTHALAELRELARGIHPVILSERGLATALDSLGQRASLPVEVSAPADRLPEPVEAAAYYLVAESLANAAKHAQASAATVTVAVDGAGLVVEVADDGVGGADPRAGSGLRGLGDRVEALGGTLSLDSPVGGGTRLRAEIPL